MGAPLTCYCRYCGGIVMAEGVTIQPKDDYTTEGERPARCEGTSCESPAVATYDGDRLVEAQA